uniref:4-alpha-glucanotransferase n=1 Tax=Eiseniibacteriota bacterium TaxID=2212470 RepID=A0A832I420_UNCEI
MSFPRRSGVLLHPTSLPGPYGIGDLGPAARRWLDWLASARQSLWQVLPLGPTGFGDSPYQSFCSFAGNPYLVSPEGLLEEGLLEPADLEATPRFPAARVDFGPVIAFKLRLLDRAFERFSGPAGDPLRAAHDDFARAHAHWLDDFALFMALKEAHGGRPWPEWDAALARREPAALAAARARLGREVAVQRFRQFAFFRQWSALRARARERGIDIVGDLPIFVAHDSSDVWAHPQLFHLDGTGRPTVVAGVPPDYFSATGQLWGNPLYRWEAHAAEGFAWWIARVRATLELVDVVRLDHFRGFEAYWEVPGDAPTAEHGRWVEGPGDALFDALREALGGLPLIAEDLGVVTPAMEALRDRHGLPGMRVIQFAFGSPQDPFLPHHHVRNAVVYSGTHDNDTARGWYATAPEAERDLYRRYTGRDGSDVAWDLIRLALSSVADTAVVPLQDVLDLGPEARMNLPGRPSGNWGWRFEDAQLTDAARARLADLTLVYDRAPDARPAPAA